MSLIEEFVSWYNNNLNPQEQRELLNFLGNLYNPKSANTNLPTLQVIPDVLVVQNFWRWYSQIPEHEKPMFDGFLRSQLNPKTSSPQSAAPLPYGQITSRNENRISISSLPLIQVADVAALIDIAQYLESRGKDVWAVNTSTNQKETLREWLRRHKIG